MPQSKKAKLKVIPKISFPTKPKRKILFSKVKGRINTIWSLIVVLATLITVWGGKAIYHQITTSKEQLYKETNYLSGIHIPDHILKSYSGILFGYDGYAKKIDFDQINNNKEFRASNFLINDSSLLNLYATLIDDKLYFSTTFYDLDGFYVGKMDYNSWEVKGNKVSYYPSDNEDYLEIRDDRDYIIFQMEYIYPNNIRFQGYYLDSKNITVVSDMGIDIFPRNKEGKFQAEDVLKKIKSLARKNL